MDAGWCQTIRFFKTLHNMWCMDRNFGFLGGGPHPDPPKPDGFKEPEGTLPSPGAVGPRAWRGARGEPRQENQKT